MGDHWIALPLGPAANRGLIDHGLFAEMPAG
jgi:hypothetical protein